MSATRCTLCKSDVRPALDKQLQAGTAYDVLIPWLRDRGLSISKSSLSRHARHVLAAPRTVGVKPVSGNFLRDVVTVASDRLSRGEIAPSIRDGVTAQAEINRQLDKMADRDLMLQLAQALGGATLVPVIEGTAVDVEAEEDADYFRSLQDGDTVTPLLPDAASRDERLARSRR